MPVRVFRPVTHGIKVAIRWHDASVARDVICTLFTTTGAAATLTDVTHAANVFRLSIEAVPTSFGANLTLIDVTATAMDVAGAPQFVSVGTGVVGTAAQTQAGQSAVIEFLVKRGRSFHGRTHWPLPDNAYDASHDAVSSGFASVLNGLLTTWVSSLGAVAPAQTITVGSRVLGTVGGTIASFAIRTLVGNIRKRLFG